MEVEQATTTTTVIIMVKCDCCELKEECTEYYINQVKSSFEGKWLCGLCAEAVRDEASRFKTNTMMSDGDAVQAHMLFCSKSRSNPAIQVADGMKQMLRRISPTSSPTGRGGGGGGKSGKKFVRSVSMSSHYGC